MSTVTFAEIDPIESTQPSTQKPFAQVTNRAIEDAMCGKLPLEVFRFYCWVCKVSNHQGRSWWSVKRQAEEFSVTTRTISRWRAVLVENRYLWLKKQMGRPTVAIVLDYPQRSAANEQLAKRATNSTNSRVEPVEAKPMSEEVTGETETNESSEEDTPCHLEEDTPCHLEEDIADVTQTISKKNKQRTTAAAKSKPKPDIAAAANQGWSIERWEHVCSVFADVGVDLRGCRTYVFQRTGETEGLRTAWDGALRHSAWVLTGRIHRSQSPIGAPLRVTIAEEALDSAPARPEPEEEQVSVDAPADKGPASEPSSFEGWSVVLADIERRVPESTFNRWFKSMGARFDGGAVTVICEDEFDASFVEKNFTELIQINLGKVGMNGPLMFSYGGDDR